MSASAVRRGAADADATLRKRRGAWYTPPWLVEHVLDQVVAHRPRRPGANGELTVLDPACGDGRFLAAAARRWPGAHLVGIDIDDGAIASARASLGAGAELAVGDALTSDWGARRFDVVVGNPPFLNQLAALTTRGRRSSLGGGPYADAAAEFLALAVHLARTDGGCVGLLQPLSMLAARDTAALRDRVLELADVTWCWWSPSSVFPEAEVRTCAIGLVRGGGPDRLAGSPTRGITRMLGQPPVERQSLAAERLRRGATWSALVADSSEVPPLDGVRLDQGGATLVDLAVTTADFRDQYYGLVGAVEEAVAGRATAMPRLVTSGAIDAAHCHWGSRPVTFARRRFDAPVVDLTRLSPAMVRWAERRLVPKVLVASQTAVIEAVVDEAGTWLPSVPVVSVVPRPGGDLWRLAAILSNPVTSAWAAHGVAGSGLSGSALRIGAPLVSAVPLPPATGEAHVERATRALRRGDLVACGEAMLLAYGVSRARDREALLEWWRRRAVGGGAQAVAPRFQGAVGEAAPGGAVSTS
jgi:SAM-dependent methyltransferase